MVCDRHKEAETMRGQADSLEESPYEANPFDEEAGGGMHAELEKAVGKSSTDRSSESGARSKTDSYFAIWRGSIFGQELKDLVRIHRSIVAGIFLLLLRKCGKLCHDFEEAPIKMQGNVE